MQPHSPDRQHHAPDLDYLRHHLTKQTAGPSHQQYGHLLVWVTFGCHAKLLCVAGCSATDYASLSPASSIHTATMVSISGLQDSLDYTNFPIKQATAVAGFAPL
mmetsp:Transcript_5613/g.14305  ORF Transcript_5613/g.14305 Transcript_5613/m.14305 type:complete len:104 (+) Transcript_5613:2670-2981(+)